jgi:hypothetical protein
MKSINAFIEEASQKETELTRQQLIDAKREKVRKRKRNVKLFKGLAGGLAGIAATKIISTAILRNKKEKSYPGAIEIDNFLK